MGFTITFGVLTVSDSCHAGTKVDTSGPKLQEAIRERFPNSNISHTKVIADDLCSIKDTLISWCEQGCNIILTTGGTGFSPRDVTPEATLAVIQRQAPAITQCITQNSLAVTPMAMLSRAVCGIRDTSIIINLPGSAKASVECFSFVAHVLKHAIEVLLDHKEDVVKSHSEIQCESKVKIGCAALRDRKSPYPMIPVDQAIDIIKFVVEKKFNCKETELVDIKDALNRVIAEDVVNDNPLPPFPASTKDGYAVIASDGAGVRCVRDVVAAGDKLVDSSLRTGEIVRISTGAAVPPGADAVVQVEDTDLVEASSDYTQELKVRINIDPKVGINIRPVGSDIPKGFQVLQRNDVLSPAHIGVLASIGKIKVAVYKQFSIGIISTGNELQSPHETLLPGHIRDSNKLTLINLMRQYNYHADDCGIARDDPNDVKRTLMKGLRDHDVIISTGGVSMGEYDVIKQVLVQDFGADILFGRVDMKPGKPTTFATCTFNGTEKLIFALPGNPVSATITSILFVIPAFRYKESLNVDSTTFRVVLDVDVPLDPRPEYMRGQITRKSADGKLCAQPTGNQISSKLNSLVGSQILLVLPAETPERAFLARGTVVDAIRIDPYFLF